MLLTEKEISQGFSLKDKSACLIGCGGLGCNIAVHLAGMGIGRLILCDFDKVSQSNLNRQFLFRACDTGQSKCLKAAESLRAYAPEIDIVSKDIKINCKEDLSFALDCDIILLAVDNHQARDTVSEFCTENKIPLVTGGIDGFYGLCYLYIPQVSPCPACAGFSEISRAKHNVSATAGIIGSAQAALAAAYLTENNPTLSGKLLIYDNGLTDTLEILPGKTCRICRNNK